MRVIVCNEISPTPLSTDAPNTVTMSRYVTVTPLTCYLVWDRQNLCKTMYQLQGNAQGTESETDKDAVYEHISVHLTEDDLFLVITIPIQ